MGKRLVITEKPSVARDIVAAIGGFQEEDGFWEGDEFLVTFAVGHLLELPAPEDLDPKYKRWTLDTLPILPESFPVKPKSGASDRLRVIKKLEKRPDVEGLVNACDAGREGELIFREIAEYLGSDKPIERLWLQSMTTAAITEGFSSLQDGKGYEGLSAAAHCRNYSDWLIGMNATRALTRRLKTRSENQAWSAGRVQTPTLAMLVRREHEILAHRAEPYWKLLARFEHATHSYDATWYDPKFTDSDAPGRKDDRIFDEARAQALLDAVQGQPAEASETRKPSREAAPALFDLTSLQREANRRFGWSARRTLNAAQRCYEAHKVLTYPRTDTKALPNDYRPVVDEVIEALAVHPDYAASSERLKREGLLNTEKIFDDARVTDHFAIVPTGVLANDLSGDDARIFDLVTRRFLAAFHPPAVWSRIERTTRVAEQLFRTRTRALETPGWRAVLGEEGEKAEVLPQLVSGASQSEGVSVRNEAVTLQEEATKPPPRITEARILSLMENAGKEVDDDDAAEAMRDSGIGTPATRADIIENLISKGYALRTNRALRPSVKGIRLIDILHRMSAERLASPALTGALERDLADVEHGKNSAEHFMREVYEYTREIVDLTKNFEFEDLYPDTDPLGPCPLCGKEVYERSWFYRCKEPPGLPKRRPKKGEPPDPNAVVDCPFRIWKDKAGRYVDRATAAELVQAGKSGELDGFMTRQGRTYRGVLEVVDGEIQLQRVAGGDEEVAGLPEYEVDETPLGKCPTCQEGEVKETRTTFICSQGLAVLRALEREETTLYPLKAKEIPEGMTYCSFLLPRTVCKREITRDEAVQYMKDARTDVLSDFISQKGRPFSATLFLKDTGRHGFEFPPRGGAKTDDGGTAATKKKATKKKATKKKATKKKATKKKATKKKATKKKATKKKATKKKATKKKAASQAEATTAAES